MRRMLIWRKNQNQPLAFKPGQHQTSQHGTESRLTVI
jgi:hypothetical protein